MAALAPSVEICLEMCLSRDPFKPSRNNKTADPCERPTSGAADNSAREPQGPHASPRLYAPKDHTKIMILYQAVSKNPWLVGSLCLYYTLLYSTLLYSTLLCYAVLCYAVLCYAILSNLMLYYPMLCYPMLYYTILYYTILYYTILD